MVIFAFTFSTVHLDTNWCVWVVALDCRVKRAKETSKERSQSPFYEARRAILECISLSPNYTKERQRGKTDGQRLHKKEGPGLPGLAKHPVGAIILAVSEDSFHSAKNGHWPLFPCKLRQRTSDDRTKHTTVQTGPSSLIVKYFFQLATCTKHSERHSITHSEREEKGPK